MEILSSQMIKMRSVGWNLIRYDCVLIKKGKFEHGWTHTGEHHVKMKAEVGVIHLQIEKRHRAQQTTEIWARSMGQIFPHSSEGSKATDTLISYLQPPEL